jgi:hypothetical protein
MNMKIVTLLRHLPGLATLVILSSAACLSASAADSPVFKVGDFTFTRPAGWEPLTVSGAMRAAELKVPSPDAKTNADVVFFQFGAGQGGTVQGNIDRWLGQFSEPKDKLNSKIENVTVGTNKVTYVSAEGTYTSAMSGTAPAADTGFLGAIIGGDTGNRVFVRMTGPKALVTSSAAGFKKMIEGGLK